MSPFLYEPMVAGRQEVAHNRAALSRLRKADASEPDRVVARSGTRSGFA